MVVRIVIRSPARVVEVLACLTIAVAIQTVRVCGVPLPFSLSLRVRFTMFGDKFKRVTEAMGGYKAAQVLYDGPYPDLVLTFELRNTGRRAAKDVSGEVAFDRAFLEPINFPLLDGEVLEGFEIAPLARKEATLKVGKVPPFPSEDTFMFRIALLKKSSEKTTIGVTFSTPEGDHLEEHMEFELP